MEKLISLSEDPSALEKQGMLPHPHWPVWRPIPSSLVGSTPYLPNDRSLYTLYGGLFGLNTNFMFPPVAFHSLVSANNLRLRDSIPTSASSYPPAESTGLHHPTAAYRYHPYLSPDKMAAAQKSAESSVMDGCRPWWSGKHSTIYGEITTFSIQVFHCFDTRYHCWPTVTLG